MNRISRLSCRTMRVKTWDAEIYTSLSIFKICGLISLKCEGEATALSAVSGPVFRAYKMFKPKDVESFETKAVCYSTDLLYGPFLLHFQLE